MPKIVIVFSIVMTTVLFACNSSSNKEVEEQEVCASLLPRNSLNLKVLKKRFDSLRFELIASVFHLMKKTSSIIDEPILSNAHNIDFELSFSLDMIDYYATNRQRFCLNFDDIFEEVEGYLEAEPEVLHRAQTGMVCACVKENDFEEYINFTKRELLNHSIIKIEKLVELSNNKQDSK